MDPVTVLLASDERGFFPFPRGGLFLFGGGLADARIWFYYQFGDLLYLGFSRGLAVDSDSGNRNGVIFNSPLPVVLLLQSPYSIAGVITPLDL